MSSLITFTNTLLIIIFSTLLHLSFSFFFLSLGFRIRRRYASPAGMATDPPEGYGDDFLEQILAIPSYNITGCLPVNTVDFTGSETVSVHHQQQPQQQLQPQQFPLGLSLDNGHETIGGAFAGQQLQQQGERGGSMNMSDLFPHTRCYTLFHRVFKGSQLAVQQ
ncbi:hypothetical protein HanPI659440_Chr17g0670711 [Helianthus annuus]|nr:hypothetical protein HanPI659440_Chr17g0670711 [Helianthus annuus]